MTEYGVLQGLTWIEDVDHEEMNQTKHMEEPRSPKCTKLISLEDEEYEGIKFRIRQLTLVNWLIKKSTVDQSQL